MPLCLVSKCFARVLKGCLLYPMASIVIALYSSNNVVFSFVYKKTRILQQRELASMFPVHISFLFLGCSMEIDAAYGLITPPVMWATREYPSQLTCIWMLTASVKEKEVMYINIFNLDLDKDPRTNPQSNDTLKVG